MLKIFIKSVTVLILCANTLYGDEYLPSTSPDIKVLKSEHKIQKLQKVNNENTITFSEFSSGTKITTQYADRGIVFKGDSPFITSDGSNPTSPVLSGTPTFDGAIEGHFVDPKTHEPTTVNHFELDGGYFNNLSSDDKLSIYGKNENQQQKMNKKGMVQKQNNENETFDYPYPNHISITTVGGKLLKVTDTQTQKEVVLNPIIGRLEEDKGYLKDNMLITEFLLPKSSVYKIEFQKYKQYPAFEVYAKIPTNDGKVEIINYENLATNEDDSTLAHFLVGNGNSEKDIKREGESDIAPTYDESIDMKLTSVVSINAIVLENVVKLLWQNSVHPNYKESVVVRKEDSIPTSITDGTEIYRGTDEEFLDTTVASEKKYYYAVYAVSKDNEPTEPVWTDVDTYRYTLYGTLTDTSDEPISGATVTLYNGTKTRLIETSLSSNNGLFSFNNLLGACRINPPKTDNQV